MSRPTLDNTVGATFIGVIVAAVFYGITCVQVFYYYGHYSKKDGWAIKAVVGATWLTDTIHQALISHSVYTYVVTNYNNPAYLSNLVWSSIVEVLFNGFTALFAQTFFTIRIWKLSNHNIILTVSLAALVLAEFVSVVIFVARALPMNTFAELSTLKALTMTINALAVAADVLIAAAFCVLLHASRTGFKRSDNVINTLIIFSVNTGLLTSICAIGSLVSIILSPETFIYIGLCFLIGRLYCNSLLATLNARKAIRERGEGVTYSLSLQMIDRLNGSSARTPIKSSNNEISVKVETGQDFMAGPQSPKPINEKEITEHETV